jgi:hypothetical protein
VGCANSIEVVVKALEHFRRKRWNEARSLDDLERLMARFPEDQAGNTALAQHLWGYNFWTAPYSYGSSPATSAAHAARRALCWRARGSCKYGRSSLRTIRASATGISL